MGHAFRGKGAWDEAIAAYNQAIRLKPDEASIHYNLGLALENRGALDEAIAAYKDAIRFHADYAEAFCNVGQALKQKGQFSEALTALRRGDELGSRNPRWPYPSARWVQECERLVDLDGRLPAVLRGEVVPVSAAERIEFAKLCALKKLNVASAHLFQQAFASQPELANDIEGGRRYDAACCAALAGSGKGEDAVPLDEAKRATWRRQTLEWLRADLAYWARQAESDSPQARLVVQKKLEHWRRDPDFSGVRGEAALATLPEAERDAWRKLWTDVENTLAKSRRMNLPEEKSQKKLE